MLRVAAFAAVLALAWPGPASAAPAGPPRTPPGDWSAEGYQQLRFGMGPGDVEDALRKGEGPLYLDKALELETAMPGLRLAAPSRSGVDVAGRGASGVVLGFWQDQLYLVAIVLSGKDKDPGNPEWFKETARLLTTKYGAPATCGAEECTWTRGDLRIHLGISLETKEKVGGIEYASISRSAKVDQAIEALKDPSKKSPEQKAKDL